MSVITHGMNTSEVRALAAALIRCGRGLERSHQQVMAALRRTDWQGTDARWFRQRWCGELAPDLARSSRCLADLGEALQRQAREQETASSDVWADLFAGGKPMVVRLPERTPAMPWARSTGLPCQPWLDALQLSRSLAPRIGAAVLGEVAHVASGFKRQGLAAGAALLGSAAEMATGLGRQGLAAGAALFSSAAEVATRLRRQGLMATADIVTRAGAVHAGLKRQGQAQNLWWSNLAGGFRLDPPTVGELMASGGLLAGTAVGTAANFLTGEDQRLFEQGEPWVGEVTAIVEQPSPESLADVLVAVDRSYEDEALTVVAVTGSDNQVRFIVALPGTQADISSVDGWNGDDNGRDWSANGWLEAGGSTSGMKAAEAAVLKAVETYRASHPDAVIPDSPEVLLAGHSQGGLLAVYMAADPEFREQVSVAGVASIASPGESADIPEQIPVVSIEHGKPINPITVLTPFQSFGDLIPKLDLGGKLFQPPNQEQLFLPPVGEGIDIRNNHEVEDYLASMREPEAAQRLAAWARENPQVAKYFVGEGTATRMTVQFGQR